ncbi:MULTISPECIES: hypothetical protein [Sphingobium]|uniref:hypothetical protein n=1 Tax=Sphingobium TaxID=165695 RepID=UPI00179AD3BA|nr:MULTISPECIES: hypothetical protein [Sphingobium]MCW2363559.1 hypothetical protein [Sphingobium sp. B10D3B]MCW2391924.1 hypothetical protein [Sphingobium sp. B11D3A]MCW2403042.1 hypothetical protein [Sphingobium sp. B10D7B]MCW2410021.1 hypothetical protein [Sphingobium xanthum]
MKFLVRSCVAVAFVLTPQWLQAEPLNRDAVFQLTKLGLGDDAVIAKIQADKVDFDLSTDEMIEMKGMGVSSAVIAAAISNRYVAKVEPSLDSPDPMVSHPAGLYVFYADGGTPRMQRMEATVTNQAKTGGIFGYALTGGLASMSVKAVVQNETSRVPVSTKPRFYFFSSESNGDGAGAWASGLNTVINSPAELTLIRLTKKDDRREARVGSVNIGGAKTGVMDKDRIMFSHTAMRPGVFMIEPSENLEPGEYGFIYSLAGGGANGAMTARIFDFTVR